MFGLKAGIEQKQLDPLFLILGLRSIYFCAAIKVRNLLPHPLMLPSFKLVSSSKCSRGLRIRPAIYGLMVAEWQATQRCQRLHDAQHSTLYGIRRFAQTLTLDLAAVRNAITERWSNGQVEGQINRLKMLKRAMYGRAGVDLLRARMMPLKSGIDHPV